MQGRIREEIETTSTERSESVMEKFLNLYESLHRDLLPRRYQAKIQENIAYGPHERNVLDVYMPREGSPRPGSELRQVMVYVHGGGLVSGDKWLKDLVYANIGHYFASYDIIAVIVNYRLVPNVTYPGGADDIQLVREWVYKNISKPEFGAGDPHKVVLVGQSAGGLHVATNVYAQAAGDLVRVNAGVGTLFPPIAGVIYLSTPFHLDSIQLEHMKNIKEYYGTSDPAQVLARTPVGLTERVPRNSPVLGPKTLPCLFVLTQYDTKEVQDPVFDFLDKYRRYSPKGILPEFTVISGHNHITNVFSIGTEDDLQGKMLREFIDSVC